MNLNLSAVAAAAALLPSPSLTLAQETKPIRPADVISPISDKVLTNKVSAADARRAGRAASEKPTPQNSIMLFIDHQIGLMACVRDFH